MRIPFSKYHGTGNDFVIVDNRNQILTGNETAFFAQICHRRFGIGADGVILLNLHRGYDFEMDYFNSDGNRSSMCGNGGRCIVKFAADLGIVHHQVKFLAVDGEHEAVIMGSTINLKMGVPTGFRFLSQDDYWIHTGSPHFVRFIPSDIHTYEVVQEGRSIRRSKPWELEGTNVNFVSTIGPSEVYVRTYERGVEDETWSCGTGVTAVAEVIAQISSNYQSPILLHTPGGLLRVHLVDAEAPWLEGPATFVFSGEIQFDPND